MGKDHRRNGQRFTPEHYEEMFEYWCQHQSLQDVATHFNHSRSTVDRAKNKYDWVKRGEKVRNKVRQKVEKRVEQKIVSNLEYIVALKKKLLAQILGKPDTTGTIKDLIAIMEYEDKLMGNFPEDTNIVNVFNTMPEESVKRLVGESAAVLGFKPSSSRF